MLLVFVQIFDLPNKGQGIIFAALHAARNRLCGSTFLTQHQHDRKQVFEHLVMKLK